MEFMQLEMFVTVVEESSVGRAAARVHRTQPAVSIAMKKLEDEIGTPLFDKSNRQDIKLTQAGEMLFEYALRLLQLRSEAFTAVDDLNNLRLGKLRVGANESVSLYLLPTITSCFQKNFPNVKIEVKCNNSDHLLHDLQERKLDIALLSHLPEDNEYDATPIMHDELVLITSPAHSLTQRQSVSIKDLGYESFIAEDVGSPWRKKFVEAFKKRQTPLNIIVDNAPIETIKKMVEMNLGVGFVPLMCVREEVERGKLAIVAVKDFHQERTLWAVQRKRALHSFAAKTFMRVVTSLTDELPNQALATTSNLLSLPRNSTSKKEKLRT
ncbi:MAG: LysR family transcriptional regulator [Acidobacteria bacterium]|nr:LysR family transcriptional regulator [Acidobacteriota bacterium]